MIHYLVNAAGRNANFLLNVGPMPNGRIQPEFTDSLKRVGEWLRQYGETIYGTRGGKMMPKEWGVTTTKNKSVYVHILNKPKENSITVQGIDGKAKACQLLKNKMPVKFKQSGDNVTLELNGVEPDDFDTVIEIRLK